MRKRNSNRHYISRRERLYRHYKGWKMLLLLLLLAIVVWLLIDLKEVLAYLQTFTY